ncbi:MAG TPA: nuclear transport factor 2 family protein [Verrucomicrobiae bacterium]|nr:nuclear transport factor 2 family protein [Verrucomicrobiae bacterium]
MNSKHSQSSMNEGGSKAGAARGSEESVAQITERELQLVAAKNRTEFLVNPRSLLEFYDRESIQYFDLNVPLLEGEAYAEMLDRVAPEFIGKAAIHKLRVEASGDVGVAWLFETYTGYARENRQPLDLTFRITHGWKRKAGVWLLVHEHYSYPVDAKTGLAQFSFPVT